MARLSKTVSTSGSDFASLVKGSVHEFEATQPVSKKTEEEVERQKRLVPEAERAKMNSLDDVASLCERVVVAGARELELLYNASAASSQMKGSSTELHHAHDTISTKARNSARSGR